MLSPAIVNDPDVQRYISGIKPRPSENDPALILDWNPVAVAAFVAGANDPFALNHLPMQADFLVTTEPGQMTSMSLMADVMAYLAGAAGGRHGLTILAPNTAGQYGNISADMQTIEAHPWMQSILQRFVPAGQHLATIFTVTDRTVANATPVNRNLRADMRQAFR